MNGRRISLDLSFKACTHTGTLSRHGVAVDVGTSLHFSGFDDFPGVDVAIIRVQVQKRLCPKPLHSLSPSGDRQFAKACLGSLSHRGM
jgi:hypothetical protein